MKEETFVLIKPDSVKKDVWFKIIQTYLYEGGFVVRRARILRLDKKTAKKFYKEHRGRLYKGWPYFKKVVRHAVSGYSIALLLYGENAIERVREINGATNPAEAKRGTIRRKFGDPDHIERNSVHASDSRENVEREKALIFGKVSP